MTFSSVDTCQKYCMVVWVSDGRTPLTLREITCFVYRGFYIVRYLVGNTSARAACLSFTYDGAIPSDGPGVSA